MSKRETGKLVQKILLVFTAVYLLSMGMFFVIQMQQCISKEQDSLNRYADYITGTMGKSLTETDSQVTAHDWPVVNDENVFSGLLVTLLPYTAKDYDISGDCRNQQYKIEVYDESGSLITQSSNILYTQVNFSGSQKEQFYFFRDILSAEDIDYLAECLSQNEEEETDKYRLVYGCVSDQYSRAALTGLYLEKLEWKRGTGKNQAKADPFFKTVMTDYAGEQGILYTQMDAETVWKWNNPSYSNVSQEYFKGKSTDAVFPYLKDGYENWKQWMTEPFFTGSSDSLKIKKEIRNCDKDESKAAESFGWWKRYSQIMVPFRYLAEEEGVDGVVGEDTDYITLDKDNQTDVRTDQSTYLISDQHTLYIRILAVAYPWKTALYEMRFLFPGMFAGLGLCAGILLVSLIKMEKKRSTMEQSRRDYTNALAHELKTPLAVIRMFSENMMEHVEEAKRAHYLETIIEKTENVDELVVSMIEASHMDAVNFSLQKTELILNQMVDTAIEKLEPVMKEKHLAVQVKGNENILLWADEKYMQQVIWNLMCNAVEYANISGKIVVELTKKSCMIQNTGDRIPEEKLPHIWEMFYRGQEERGGSKKHFGMGLYLVKKILDMHGMKYKAENKSDGVCFTIQF